MREYCTLIHEGIYSVTVHVIGPRQVDIPWKHVPDVSLWIEVEEPVFTIADVAVMYALNNGTIRVIALEVDVIPPPLLSWIGVIVVTLFERVKVGFVGYSGWALIVQLPIMAFDFIEITVGQEVLVQEPAVHLLNDHIKPPEVTVELCHAEFSRLVDYTIV